MHRKPNPDDRSDNVEKMQEMIHDTIDNINESENDMSSMERKEQEKIIDKNKRRKEAIDGFRNEIKDEL